MRKKPTTILATVLAAVLFAAPASAQEQKQELEIRTTGGAFAGKYRFKEIDPTEALLEFPLAGRTVQGVNAGFIANRTYREVWSFNDSILIYDRLPRQRVYRSSNFNERSASIRFCGRDFEENCEILETDKRSRNLIIVKYEDLETGSMCAGLHYIGEDRTVRGPGLYGNYSVVVNTCTQLTYEPTEALARSAFYMSLIKKDERTIAELARYNLPEPDFSDDTPAFLEPDSAAVDENVRRLLNANNCEGCDLRGAVLFEADLANANLKGAILSGAVLTDAKFSGADLTGANLGGTTRFTDADFSGANLASADFRGAIIDSANFTGANLTGASFQRGGFLFVNFSEANFDRVDLTGMDLSETTLKDAKLDGAILCKTKMPWGEENSGC